MGNHVRQNLRWALSWAGWLAAAFSAWVVLASLARGSFQWPEYHATTWKIILSYWVAALLGGGLVGLLRPVTQFRFGAFLVGWIAGTLVYGSVAVAGGFAKEAPLWLAAIPGLIVGGGLALVWFDEGPYVSQSETNWRFVAVVLVIAAVLMAAMKVAGWW